MFPLQPRAVTSGPGQLTSEQSAPPQLVPQVGIRAMEPARTEIIRQGRGLAPSPGYPVATLSTVATVPWRTTWRDGTRRFVQAQQSRPML
jgi:hypothetical protein